MKHQRTHLISSIFSCLFLIFSFHSVGQTYSQGPNPPSVVGEQWIGCLACPGASWQQNNNVMEEDTQYAFVGLYTYPDCFQSACYIPRGLMPSGFGFNIPASATITGIELEVVRKSEFANTITDSTVRLLNALNSVGGNKALPNYWPDNPTSQVYGSPNDLWSSSWTPADINSTGFGLMFKPMNTDSVLMPNAMVDYIGITVYYELPTGINETDEEILNNVYYDAAAQSILIENSSGDLQKAIVFNSLGEQVAIQKMDHSATNKISAAEFPAGVYLVYLISEEKTFTCKVGVVK